MTNVIELSSIQNTFHRSSLEEAGLPQPLTWQIVGVPGAKYQYRGVTARPTFVAHHRISGSACVVHMLAGMRPSHLDLDSEQIARLETVVVAASLKMKYPDLNSYQPRIIYDTGHRFDLEPIDSRDWEVFKRLVKAYRKSNDVFDVSIKDVIQKTQQDRILKALSS